MNIPLPAIVSLSWLFVLMTIGLNTAASLLLKLSTGSSGPNGLLIVSGSMVCYGLSFLSYYVCLRSLPVSVAYPVITGGAILAIVLMATPVLGEPMTGSKMLGAALVIFGGMLLLRQP